jgi:hypothetical protein
MEINLTPEQIEQINYLLQKLTYDDIARRTEPTHDAYAVQNAIAALRGQLSQ